MRYELHPELVAQNKLKWAISLCLTIPPFAPNVFPVGQAGIMGNADKILIFMQLTRANVQLPPNQDPVSIVIPVIYNIKQNQTMLANLDKGIGNQHLHAVVQHLTNFSRTNTSSIGRCTIFPAIWDLLMKLTLPNEGGNVAPNMM